MVVERPKFHPPTAPHLNGFGGPHSLYTRKDKGKSPPWNCLSSALRVEWLSLCLGLTICKMGIMITYVGVFPVTNNHKLGGLKQVEVPNPFHLAKISVSRHCRSAPEARGRTLHCLFIFRWLLAFLDLWLHHYSLCPFGYTACPSSVCQMSLCLPLQRMPVIAFRVHLIIQDNPLPHLQILKLTCKDCFHMR